MNIGEAVTALKEGHKVARAGWNGKGMWLAYSPGVKNLVWTSFWAPSNRNYAIENGGGASVLPCITLKTVTGEILMGWNASTPDLLADDWEIVP